MLAARLRRARAPSSIAAAVGRAPVEAVALAGALGAADNARSWIEQLRFVTLSISGADLIAAGVPAGPAIGAGLRAALSASSTGAPATESRAGCGAAGGACPDGPGRWVSLAAMPTPRRSTSSPVISRSNCRERGPCSRPAAAACRAVLRLAEPRLLDRRRSRLGRAQPRRAGRRRRCATGGVQVPDRQRRGPGARSAGASV